MWGQSLYGSRWFDSESFQRRTEQRKGWKIINILSCSRRRVTGVGSVLTECSDFGNYLQMCFFFMHFYQHQTGNRGMTESTIIIKHSLAWWSSKKRRHHDSSRAPLDHSLLCFVLRLTTWIINIILIYIWYSFMLPQPGLIPSAGRLSYVSWCYVHSLRYK